MTEKLRITLTATGKRQMQVDDFSKLKQFNLIFLEKNGHEPTNL